MQIISTSAELRKELEPVRKAGRSIGFVPTMGFLHEGHLSLVDIAKQNADWVVVSIFVNPTQFAPHEDLDRYPRDLERDEKLLRQRATDILFYPAVNEMYPEPFYTYVTTEKLADVLCGGSRPTHFRGVTTIVAKLFNIVQPDIAVFGQKDAQQALIIKQMVRDLNFPIRIIVAPIVREPDGLAMSSRNVYLTPQERAQAPLIFQSLQAARQAVAAGELSSDHLSQIIAAGLKRSPLARIDYIAIVDEHLEPVATVCPGTFAAVAVYYGKTRLIDNLTLLDDKHEKQ